ncbi:MAG TPA: bi-domain-containing oxidoreductase [Terriglobales bacterium]|jgi:predicted dehydrogenase/threonine dehydrogenase-like Zn-dependent dehydrogenase
MKQVLQHARTGQIAVEEVPAPKPLPGCVVVRVAASLLSAGTERAASEFAGKNLLQKAKSRPDLVGQVMEKVRRDGIFSAVSAVRQRLDQPVSLGYSSAGTAVAVAEDVTDIKVGDRVACAGAGHAVHAELDCVPRLLVAKFSPESDVSFEEAAFTTVGAVVMHGVRLAEVKLGDVVGVIGLGLLGQIAVQILKAAGCRVVGTDILPERAALALGMGADGASSSTQEFHDLCRQFSSGQGVDAVLITAQTESNEPVNLAAQVARDRAAVVAVGSVGMDLSRRHYFEKELDFRVSRSYGPGRYDVAYEQKGRDYPIGYVPWTETRNMKAFLNLLEERKLNMKALITHRFSIDQAKMAYELISGNSTSYMGVLLQYSDGPDERQALELIKKREKKTGLKIPVAIGLLGAGNFANSILLPSIERAGDVEYVSVSSAQGAHAHYTAKKFGFRTCATDENKIIEDPDVNTVVVATRHHLHAAQVIAALDAGKNVFCEKPLCLRESELREIVRAKSRASKPLLMVGFNRRFAPMAVRMKTFLQGIHEPLALHYRVNAGFIPRDHWTNDPEQGGGRILGEACHFIDFLSFLTGSRPAEVHTRDISSAGRYSGDNVVISLSFEDGSQGTITYVANGDASYSKERIEVFGGNAVAVLEDFRRCELLRQGKKEKFRSIFSQDKGHDGEWRAFVEAVKTQDDAPIPFEEIVASTLATLRALDSRSSGQPERVNGAEFIQSCL